MPTKIEIGKTYGMLTVDAATEKKDYRGAEKGPAEVALSPGPDYNTFYFHGG